MLNNKRYNTMKTIHFSIPAVILFLITTGCSEAQFHETLPDEELSQSEASSLKWIREEEMLAHDVYAYLAELYDVPVFKNITRSEMQHTEAVAGLLAKYGIEDPASDHETGKFSHPQIQSLYDKLIAQGKSSYKDAILVGLQIEDLDIADLEKAIEQEVDNEDIIFVYSNLLRGSGNHLKAFWFHAENSDIDWSPEHISMEKFSEIIGESDQSD
jgi:hypothetical protein